MLGEPHPELAPTRVCSLKPVLSALYADLVRTREPEIQALSEEHQQLLKEQDAALSGQRGALVKVVGIRYPENAAARAEARQKVLNDRQQAALAAHEHRVA